MSYEAEFKIYYLLLFIVLLAFFSGCASPLCTGIIYYKRGELNKALSHFEKVRMCNPQNCGAHFWLGRIYYDMGMLDKAIREYKLAINLCKSNYPKYAQTCDCYYYFLGNCYRLIGMYDEAIRQYKKAIDCRPEWAEVYSSLAATYFYQEKYEKAIDMFNLYKSFRPTDLNADIWIADAYSELGNPKAIDLYNKLILKTQTKGQIGVWVREEQDGIKVTGFSDLSSAKAAVIKKGDIILKWGDKTVKKAEALVKLVDKSKIGDSVIVTLKRKDKILKLPVIVGSKADPFKASLASFYCKIGELEKAEKICESLIKKYPNSLRINKTLSCIYYEKGLYDESKKFYGWGFVGALFGRYSFFTREEIRILSVLHDSPAQKAGLKPGDRIFRIDGREFSDTGSIVHYIAYRPIGSKVTFTVERGEQILAIPVKVTNRFEWLRKYELGGLRRYATCVIDFESTALANAVIDKLSNLLRNVVSKTKCYRVLTEETIKQIIKSRQINLAKYTNLQDDEVLSCLGKELGVEKMIRGKIIKSYGAYIVTVVVIDVETGEAEITKTEECIGEASLEETISKLANELCQR